MDINKHRKEITPRTDIIFKNIFGKEGNENILEDLLESIIGEKVKVLKLQKSNELDSENIYEKTSILDIKAELSNNKIVNIEMQNTNYPYYNKRVLYYFGKLITTQIKFGEQYEKIKDVIVINILNYKIPGIEDYIIKCDINNGSNFCVNGGVIYFIQLPRFEEERKLLDNDVKYEDIVKNKLDEWCVFLSNKSQEVRNMVAKNNINIEEAIKQYEELSSIPEVVETAFRRRIAEMDRMAREQEAMKNRWCIIWCVEINKAHHIFCRCRNGGNNE